MSANSLLMGASSSANTQTGASSADATRRLYGGSRSMRSRTTRTGDRPDIPGNRQVSCGSSESTVPMPVRRGCHNGLGSGHPTQLPNNPQVAGVCCQCGFNPRDGHRSQFRGLQSLTSFMAKILLCRAGPILGRRARAAWAYAALSVEHSWRVCGKLYVAR